MNSLAWMPAPTPPMWRDPPFDRKPLGQEPNRFNRSAVVFVMIVAGILILGVVGLVLSFYFDFGGVKWKRYEARSGSIGLPEPGRDFNFSVRMPSNWEIEEWFPNDYRALPTADLLAWEKTSGRFRVMFEAFRPGHGEFAIARFEDIHRIWHETVEGVEVTFFEPLEYADVPGLMTGAIFPSLPAAPNGTDTLGLHIFVHRPTQVQAELVGKVIRSVRYAPPPKSPDVYEPRVKPASDWTRVKAGTDGSGPFNFSLLVPPGWKAINSIGIDNLGGTIEGDGIRFVYGFGNTIARLPTGDAQVLWYEEIDGEIVHFVRPWRDRVAPNLFTGAFFIRLPGSCSQPGMRSLVITAKGLTTEQQDLALAILKSVRDENPGC